MSDRDALIRIFDLAEDRPDIREVARTALTKINGGRCGAQALTSNYGWVQCVKPPYHEDRHVWGADSQVTPAEPFA